MISEIDGAYLAGLLDAKGSFLIKKVRESRKLGNVATYAASLAITTTSKTLVEFLGKHQGKRIIDNGSYRTWWCYEDIESLLVAAMPHMKVRLEQAALLLEFIRHSGTPERLSGRLDELNESIKLLKKNDAREEQ